MNNPVIIPVIATGANKTYVRLGFCPDVVEVVNLTARVTSVWHRLLNNLGSMITLAVGTATLETDEGISLVEFDKPGIDMTAAPAVVTDPNKANGILIADDWGAGTGLTAADILIVKAYRQTTPMVYGKHDGGASKQYLEDSDVDFVELGVCGGQQWIAISVTGQEYSFVGEVQKPFGKTKYCRCTLVDAAGNAIGAAVPDVDDDDVFWLMPAENCQYPLSDLGLAS